jgi:subtilisin family serine protease
MRAIRADAAWAAGATGAGATVCVVDSGVDDLHQELAGRVARSQSFVPNNRVDGAAGYSEVRLDSAGHGTHVASTAVGNGVVVASAAPDATLITSKVLDQTNSGLFTWIIPGMIWCADQGAHAMNVSIGGIFTLPNGVPPDVVPEWRAVADAVRYATDRGTVVVISAGNSNLQLPNPNRYVVPAQVPGAVVVGATGPVTRMAGSVSGGALLNVPVAAPPAWNPAEPSQVWQGPDGRAFYSNFGAAVDVFAPGGRGSIPFTFARRVALVPPGTVRSVQGAVFDNVFAACSRVGAYAGAPDVGGVPGAFGSCAGASNRYASLAGTSMAAPHVTGLAAILYAELGGVRTPANRARVEACLRSTADAVGPSEIFGRGRVNAERALGALRDGRC